MPTHTFGFKPTAISWIARVSGIAFALFLSVFALDVFDEHLTFWKVIPALIVHLVPCFFILLVVAIAWKRPLIAAITFALLAIGYLFFAQGRFHWSVYAIMSGSMALIALFYFLDWFRCKKLI
jgi:hypothetical protein